MTLNPSFWSLSYEIVISLLFPSFWWLVKRRRGAWSVAALVGCKLLEVWVWKHGFGSTYVAALLYYLTFFMLGVALARGRHLLLRRVQHMPRAILWSALGVSVAAYLNYILLHLQARKTDVLTAIGAVGLIILCQSPRIRIGLRSRVARFFGRVSYSLYLVHGVVLLALLDMFFGRLPKWGIGVPYGLVSVALSYLFYLAIEEQHTDWESAGHGRRAKHLTWRRAGRYWTRNGPAVDPRWRTRSTTRHERQPAMVQTQHYGSSVIGACQVRMWRCVFLATRKKSGCPMMQWQAPSTVEYPSRDPNPARKAAHIPRTMAMGEPIVARKERVSGLSFQPGRCCAQHFVAIVRPLRSKTTEMNVEHSVPFPFAFLFALRVPR